MIHACFAGLRAAPPDATPIAYGRQTATPAAADSAADAHAGDAAFSPLYQQIKGFDPAACKPVNGSRAKPSQRNGVGRRFGSARARCAKAIDALAADNLVVRRQGKGTFVATHAEQHMCSTAFAPDARQR